MILRPCQRVAVDDAIRFFENALPGDKRLYAAPTGSGKSIIELELLKTLPNLWLVTPKLEIIMGMMSKLGIPYTSENDLLSKAWDKHITTPIKFRNKLLANELDTPKGLILDESHHDRASSWQDLHLLTGLAPAVGYTASPFRGTPKGTAELRKDWGEPHWVITFQEAKDLGYLTMPECKMLPLLDDDEIEIANGEFLVSQIISKTATKLGDLVDHCRRYYNGYWDKPTMFSCPSTETAKDLNERLNKAGIKSACILQDTPYANRELIFSACVKTICCLVQISVVSEGVDLPIRRLIDLSPTLSPVLWLQKFGRITRPGGESEYVCTNRNLFRHAYVLDGVVPIADLTKAAKAFEMPSKRDSNRVLGFESLGRFKPIALPMANGLKATMYALTCVESNIVTQYCAIAHPNKADVLWAKCQNIRTEGKTSAYGTWSACEAPIEMVGYNSVNPAPITEKQKIWWERAARRHGLDHKAEINRKVFQALPVLSALGKSL